MAAERVGLFRSHRSADMHRMPRACPSEPRPAEALSEFSALNRRRLFGAPPLEVSELERWGDLRASLERLYGDRLDSVLAAVERRSHVRFATFLQMRFETGDELRSACLENLSEGGIFVETCRPLAVGSRIRLSIDTSAGHAEMRGTVRWVRDAGGSEGPAGMGVCFDDLEDPDRERIRAIVCDPALSGRGAGGLDARGEGGP